MSRYITVGNVHVLFTGIVYDLFFSPDYPAHYADQKDGACHAAHSYDDGHDPGWSSRFHITAHFVINSIHCKEYHSKVILHGKACVMSF